MRTIGFCTLGCKVNFYETESLAGLFEKEGYRVVPFEQCADVYVINTCTVTSVGDKKSRQMVRRAKRRNPSAVVAVVGCYAQVAPEEVEKIEGVDIIVGTSGRSDLPKLVAQKIRQVEQRKVIAISKPADTYEDIWLGGYAERTRMVVKIQDGCDNFCSYCIIPYARGRARSRPMEAIMQETRRVAEAGFEEIVLTGIQVASYGKDLRQHASNGVSLINVIENVHEVAGISRIRLSSISPLILTDEFVAALSRLPKVCPHFHVSLQSGYDKTLERMGRRYTFEQYLEGIERLREINDASISTDVIVGFPGETDEEFAQSYENIKRAAFSDMHVFPFSKREGTTAARMSGQVEAADKQARAERMLALAREMRAEFLAPYVGRRMQVLFEGNGGGFTPNYIRVLGEGSGIREVTLTKEIMEV